MKYLFLIAALLAGCTASCTPTFQQKPIDSGNPYAYRGMSEYECGAICQSYMYSGKKIQIDEQGRCWCDERTCGRSKNHGGCQKCDGATGCQ